MAEATKRTAVHEAAEDMEVASVLVRRWLGCWIDLIGLAALFFGPALAFGVIPQFRDLPASTFLPISVGLCLLYFPIMEGLWGRTLGKLLTGLKVVDKNGRAPGIGRAALRTVLRLLEVNPILLGGVPAGIAVLCTKRKQRLGGLVADTYVLDAGKLKQMADVDATLMAMRGASST